MVKVQWMPNSPGSSSSAIHFANTCNRAVNSGRRFSDAQLSIESSERQRQVLQTHLRLQTLWLERQRLRFEYLLRGGTFETGFWGELDNITQRLDKEWSGVEW
jgi:hypothetical protein